MGPLVDAFRDYFGPKNGAAADQILGSGNHSVTRYDRLSFLLAVEIINKYMKNVFL